MDWLNDTLEGLEEETKNTIVENLKKEIPKHFALKSDFNQKNEELKSTRAKMDELQTKIEGLGQTEQQAETFKSQLEALSSEYGQFKEEAEKRVQNIQKKQAIERGLTRERANPETIDLLMNQFELDKVQLDSKGDIVDWDLHVSPLKEARKSLFATETITGTKATTAKTVETTSYQALYNKAKQDRNLKEQIRIKQEAFKNGQIIN